MAWHIVTTTGKVSAEQPVACEVADRKLAIFQIGTDYYALDNVCPHAYALMTDGFIDDDKVECPLHGAVFHIPTGRCLGPPADADLKSYPVRIDGDSISVDI